MAPVFGRGRRWCSRWSPPGVACVVELVEDPAFGPVVGFGLGGVATELLGDRAWRAAPLTDRDAIALVDEPRAAPLLRGYRGAAPVDRDALADLLLRVGRLADEQPRVRALTLNPVLARPDGLSVLHAVVHGRPPPGTGPATRAAPDACDGPARRGCRRSGGPVVDVLSVSRRAGLRPAERRTPPAARPGPGRAA